MATIQRFEDIEVWQKARGLANHIYELSLVGSFGKDFSFRDQINRAAGSVMDNIAEGYERGGTREFIQFLSYARGSAGEVRSQLHRAFDRKHIDSVEFDKMNSMTLEVSKMIAGFIGYLQRTKLKGTKFMD